MYSLLSFFIANYTLIHCTVWVTNRNSLAQLNHYLPTPSFVIRDKAFHDVDRLGFNEIKKRLVKCLTAVHLKELNADKAAFEAAAIASAREEPV